MTRHLPRGLITLMGIVVTALMPFVLILSLRNNLSWFSGIVLFYVTLGLAQVGYVGLLVAAGRRSRIRAGTATATA